MLSPLPLQPAASRSPRVSSRPCCMTYPSRSRATRPLCNSRIDRPAGHPPETLAPPSRHWDGVPPCTGSEAPQRPSHVVENQVADRLEDCELRTGGGQPAGFPRWFFLPVLARAGGASVVVAQPEVKDAAFRWVGGRSDSWEPSSRVVPIVIGRQCSAQDRSCRLGLKDAFLVAIVRIRRR